MLHYQVIQSPLVMQKLKIGDRSVIGLGSVVLKSVNEFEVIAGNPSRLIKRLKNE